MGGSLNQPSSVKDYSPTGFKLLLVTHVEKDGVLFYLLVNEGNTDLHFHAKLPVFGQLELWDPWRGTVKEAGNGNLLPISLGFRECIVLAVKKAEEEIVPVTFTQQLDNKTLSYDAKFSLAADKTLAQFQVQHNAELARVWIDEENLDIQMWKPYTFACDKPLAAGEHTLRVEITAGLSSKPEVAPTSVTLQLI